MRIYLNTNKDSVRFDDNTGLFVATYATRTLELILNNDDSFLIRRDGITLHNLNYLDIFDASGTQIAGTLGDVATYLSDILNVQPVVSGGGGDIYDKLVIAKTPQDLQNIDSTSAYLIDGVIDFTGTGLNIVVPASGVNLLGLTFDVSKLICGDANYTLFESPVGGSGNVLFEKIGIEITGSNSQVFALTSATGFDAFEFQVVNFNFCTSLGWVDSYRQGLENGTGRIGGTPTLELRGNWIGGYRVTTTIAVILDAAMSTPIFKAGAGFVMNNRFLTDINASLPTNASLLDFSPANFTKKETLQLNGCNINRNGVFDNTDPNIIPNITEKDSASKWTNNKGIKNTLVGGRLKIVTETTTVISAIETYYDLAGVYVADFLDHFDQPANNELRYTGGDQVLKKISGNIILRGTSGDRVDIQVSKSTDNGVTWVEVFDNERIINNNAGSRDVAYYNFSNIPIELNENDRIKLEVENYTGANNVTAEVDSFIIIN